MSLPMKTGLNVTFAKKRKKRDTVATKLASASAANAANAKPQPTGIDSLNNDIAQISSLYFLSTKRQSPTRRMQPTQPTSEVSRPPDQHQQKPWKTKWKSASTSRGVPPRTYAGPALNEKNQELLNRSARRRSDVATAGRLSVQTPRRASMTGVTLSTSHMTPDNALSPPRPQRQVSRKTTYRIPQPRRTSTSPPNLGTSTSEHDPSDSRKRPSSPFRRPVLSVMSPTKLSNAIPLPRRKMIASKMPATPLPVSMKGPPSLYLPRKSTLADMTSGSNHDALGSRKRPLSASGGIVQSSITSPPKGNAAPINRATAVAIKSPVIPTVSPKGRPPRPSGYPPRNRFATKAARKTAIVGSDPDSDEDGTSSNSSLSKPTPQPRPYDSSRAMGVLESHPIPVYPTPPSDLVHGFRKVTQYNQRLLESRRLPFLLRNLRKGFSLECKRKSVTFGLEQKVALEVEYRLDNQTVHHTARAQQLFCPLCNVHGVFPARSILAAHLNWDHPEVMSQWTLTSPTSWRIVITLITRASTSHVDDGDDGLEYVEDDELPFASASVTPPEGHLITQPITPSEQSPAPSRTPPTPNHEHDVAPERSERLTTVQPESPIPPPLPEIEDNDIVPIRQPSLPPIAFLPQPASPPIKEQSPTPSTEEMDTQLTSDFGRMDVSLDLDKRESLTPPPFTPTSPRPDLSVQDAPISLPPKPPKAPRPPNLPDRCPTPPPKERPLGPASQYPFLPYDSEYGGPNIHYSCRPNGPKLYDLLATLPMDRFGVLSWLVVDREEDIYEIPDISDESKVMHALWARWMMLNRPMFVEDYFVGTVAFIDEYWKIIHRAAGWDALRYYLLILVAGRFLNLAQVARALKHYEHLIGMEFWEN